MALCEKILIGGFSGSGKTSLLLEIKKQASEGWGHFHDLDQLVLENSEKEYASLSALIEDLGWEKFRLLERKELENWLKLQGRGVLALGGGTLTPLILELYKKHPKIRFCHLEASFETCWNRLIKDSKTVRPLVLEGKKKLHELFEERKKVLESLQWKLVSENEDPSDLAREFWEELS